MDEGFMDDGDISERVRCCGWASVIDCVEGTRYSLLKAYAHMTITAMAPSPPTKPPMIAPTGDLATGQLDIIQINDGLL